MTAMTSHWITAALLVLLLCGGVLPAVAGEADAAPQPYRMLIVDGTKTLEATLRLVGFATAVRQSGLAEVVIQVVDRLGSFDIPLQDEETPETPYDLILLVPTDVDRGTAYGIWVLMTREPEPTPEQVAAMEQLVEGINTAFFGLASAMTLQHDLWAAIVASRYIRQGWLR